LKNKLLILFLLISVSKSYSLFGQKEYLLNDQIIKGNKVVPTENIAALLPQKTNDKFLNTPFSFKTYFYNKGKRKHEKALKQNYYEKKISEVEQKFIAKTLDLPSDSPKYKKLKEKKDAKQEALNKKINDGNWLMTNLGQKPENANASIAEKNTEKISKYLFNNGFFNAKTSYSMDTLRPNRINVNYQIKENNAFLIQKINWTIPNKNIEKIIYDHLQATFLRVNERFQENNLNQERTRIETLLKNKGYFSFSLSQIKYKVNYDPLKPASGVIITLYMDEEKTKIQHPYEIEKVTFIIDATADNATKLANGVTIDTLSYKFVDYIFAGNKFSTKYLHRKIFLKPLELYNHNKLYETQRALQNLDQFKFANPSFDTTGNKLNLKFYAIPLEKYQMSTEGGLNVLQGIPGPFVNVSFKIRNIFGGLESLENTLRLGYEGQQGLTANSPNFRSFEAGLNSAITIPLMLLPGSYRSLDTYNPKTQIGVGFNYTDRLEYQRLNFRLGTTYSWQKSQKKNYNFSLIDLNLINTPYLSKSFSNQLDSLKLKGNNLKESFGKSFVSSISGSYVYNDNYLGQSQKGRYLRIYGELGGSLLNLTKNNEIGLVNTLLGNNLNYFKYVRILADFRKFVPIRKNNNTLLAYRINTGLALSYNKNSEALPFEKYLFAGGSYSNRAWAPRQLGLNNLRTENSENNANYLLEQPGNLLLESSLEYRFPITKVYGQLNGAFFLDYGNVFTIKTANSVARISDFQLKNFLDKMALGTGFGVRYDFTYFVIRVDAGIKVIDPTYGSKKFVFDDFFKKGKDDNLKTCWALGIGYPF
jgi:outer membrane protein assembly factor BamA